MKGSLKMIRFSDEEKKYFLRRLTLLKKLSTQIINEEREVFLREKFKELVRFFPQLGTPVTFQSPFERLVINKFVRPDRQNLRLDLYSNIKYPPPEVEKHLNYNRASLKEQSIFYGGYGKLATTLETLPVKGDICTVSKWMQKQNTTLIHLPIFFNEEIFNREEFREDWNEINKLLQSLDANVGEVVKKHLELLTDVFTKKVSKDNKLEYIFSALFADYFLNDLNSNIQCIYYPSVASDYASCNIACTPKVLDKYFDCIEIKEYIYLASPKVGVSGWMVEKTGEAINIELDKQYICWK